MQEVRNTFNLKCLSPNLTHKQTNKQMYGNRPIYESNKYQKECMNVRIEKKLPKEKSVTIIERLGNSVFKLKAINYLSQRMYDWYAKLKIYRRNDEWDTALQKRSKTFSWAYIDMGAHNHRSHILHRRREKTISNTENQWRQLNHFYRFKFTHTRIAVRSSSLNGIRLFAFLLFCIHMYAKTRFNILDWTSKQSQM